MNAVYLIPFIFWFVCIGGMYFVIMMFRKKQGTKIIRFAVTTMMIITGLLGLLFTYDLVQTMLGNTVKVSGECETEYSASSGEARLTYVRIGEDSFKIQNDDYSDLPDGKYYCDIEASPIMYNVIKAKIEEL